MRFHANVGVGQKTLTSSADCEDIKTSTRNSATDIEGWRYVGDRKYDSSSVARLRLSLGVVSPELLPIT